eukprot:3090334-Rhodomonas_salina.1
MSGTGRGQKGVARGRTGSAVVKQGQKRVKLRYEPQSKTHGADLAGSNWVYCQARPSHICASSTTRIWTGCFRCSRCSWRTCSFCTRWFSSRRMCPVPLLHSPRRGCGMLLPTPYAMSGTDIGYAATKAGPTRCPALTYAMLLPDHQLPSVCFDGVLLSSFALHTRCPVLTYAYGRCPGLTYGYGQVHYTILVGVLALLFLVAPYPSVLRVAYAMSGTDTARDVRYCSAMSGTDVASAPLRDVWY